ncbi:hypothetical protein [Sphingomonas sp. 2378]|uniref:hypothetical protein n=1 Tax=Sphingomonas sp. 2378 TaxID=1219748 RepID=UPI00311B1BD4
MRYENRTFENEELILDGNDYIDCTFRNCRMVLHGTGSGTIEPFSGNGVEFQFKDGAASAVSIHQTLMEAGLSQSAPIGSFLRIGTSWFQRIPKPMAVGSEGEKTTGLGVVIITDSVN